MQRIFLVIIPLVLVFVPTAWGSEMLDAVAAGDSKKIGVLLDANPKAAEDADDKGNTALILAAGQGKTEALAALIAHKVNLDLRNRANESPLYCAVVNDREEAAVALMDAGAKVNCMASSGSMPLSAAIDNGDVKLVQALIDHGANVNCPARNAVLDQYGRPNELQIVPPIQAAARKGNLAMVKVLIASGADSGLRSTSISRNSGEYNVPLLHTAIQSGNRQLVEYIIQSHCDLNAKSLDGSTALHLAVQTGSLEIASLLLENKADPNLKNNRGDAPISMIGNAGKNGPELKALFAKYGIKEDGSRATIQNLKSLATAEAQFIKKMDYYSASGKSLNQTGTLIAADLAAAFENYLDNGDPAKPVPKAGYIYRMLQGDGNDPKSWHRQQDPGMNTWAVVARPASGEGYQYYITEAGTVYQKKDPGTGKFLLDVCPPPDQTDWEPAR